VFIEKTIDKELKGVTGMNNLDAGTELANLQLPKGS
jgi:hypothetical protein